MRKVRMCIQSNKDTNIIQMSFLAPKPPRNKCGLPKPCPEDYLAFKITSGAASVVGPKICLQDNM